MNRIILALLVGFTIIISGCTTSDQTFDTPEDPDTHDPEGGSSSGTSGNNELNYCGTEYAPALPATQKLGDDANWFQFHQFQGVGGTGSVYVSWRLETEFFEPEGWVFGTQIWDNQHQVQGQVLLEKDSEDCHYIGESPPGFGYFVEAGPWRWSQESECTLALHWGDEVGDRLEFSVESSNGTLGPYPWSGGPYDDDCPTDGAKFIRQVIHAAGGRAGTCVSCVLPDESRLSSFS